MCLVSKSIFLTITILLCDEMRVRATDARLSDARGMCSSYGSEFLLLVFLYVVEMSR